MSIKFASQEKKAPKTQKIKSLGAMFYTLMSALDSSAWSQVLGTWTGEVDDNGEPVLSVNFLPYGEGGHVHKTIDILISRNVLYPGQWARLTYGAVAKALSENPLALSVSDRAELSESIGKAYQALTMANDEAE